MFNLISSPKAVLDRVAKYRQWLQFLHL